MERGHEIWYLECRSQYRSGWFATAARELARYKLDLLGVQEIR